MKLVVVMLCTFASAAAIAAAAAADFDLAASATNQFAVDLYHQLGAGDGDLCVSPCSIESALAMTFAGADGETRAEMARVLHLPNDGDAIHVSFASLQQWLEQSRLKAAKVAEESKKRSGPSEPITLTIANRLFAQRGYDFRDSFQALVKQYYGAAFATLDFQKNDDDARQQINKWVADQTHNRIRDLVPAEGLHDRTRLLLANAIYFKAQWVSTFPDAATTPQPFHVRGGKAVDVPMMRKVDKEIGYRKLDGFTAVSIPYTGHELQLLVLLPDEVNGLSALEAKLNADLLGQCAKLHANEVDLSLPKFKMEPPTVALADKLEALGMKSAFDLPPGSANFDRMAPRKPNDYLAISQVFHKTFIAIDEKGTEASAATAVVGVMVAATSGFAPPHPIEVKVDRPFLYVIQHVPSGACLFMGRVTDPR
jgi:serpin B